MIDSSILAVPGISTANSHVDASSSSNGSPGLDDVARQPFADARAEDLSRGPVGRRQLALERDRQQLLALADEDAAIVVVDQLPQFVCDRHPDLADVVRAVELAGERLEHLQVRDRADVLAAGVPGLPAARCRTRRRRRRGSCRAPSRSSSPPRRRRRARVDWPRARAPARFRSRPRWSRQARARPRRGARRAGLRARSSAPGGCRARSPRTPRRRSGRRRRPRGPSRAGGRRAPRSTSSPTACPKTSLTFLKSSMSTITTATFVCSAEASVSSRRRRSWK